MAQLVQELSTDLSFGTVDSAAPTAMPKNACSSILNGRLQPDGTIRRRWGSQRTHPSVLNAATGWGGVRFRTAAGAEQMVVFFGTKAYYSTDQGATWTQAATGLHEDYYSFATMRVGATNYLFAANGDTTIKKWTGSAWGTVANAPSGVKYVAVFNGRLYATGHSGVIVQASAIGDPETWASPNGLTVQILTNSGNTPTAMFQLGPHLLVSDLESTSYIDGYGQATLVVAVGAIGFSRSVGCAAFRTMVGVGDNGAAWLSRRGVEYYTAASGIVLVSKGVQNFLQGVDWDKINSEPGVPSAAYDETDQNYCVMLPTGSLRLTRCLVINLLQQVQWQRPGPRAAASIDRYPASGGGLLFSGDAAGYLQTDPAGFEFKTDVNGYASPATLASGASDPTSSDASGYLTTVTNDTVPATLFTAPAPGRPSVIHSLGSDGFVRRHLNANTDDALSDGTAGTAVELDVTSRAFLAGRPRQRKRARAVHVAAIAQAQATLTVSVTSGFDASPDQAVTIPATLGFDAQRRDAAAHLVSDEPHVRVRTTDDIRLSLLGLTSEPMREPTR